MLYTYIEIYKYTIMCPNLYVQYIIIYIHMFPPKLGIWAWHILALCRWT